ncbi:hypothetical protein F511_30385 [Dorcoceras hygrometricum]|uniref:Root cap n=1 Tax=Dorcoceras hygrometricum TaxID=472368 RepID=A0A2Z7CCI2_9LAMI|nr:hypothetical protein F511_30385 [Dorcoceras hygrometricum]
MGIPIGSLWFMFLALILSSLVIQGAVDTVTCTTTNSKCYLQSLSCPSECPQTQPSDSKAKACYLNCNSPICKPECKKKKPNCEGPGAACLDPRFIGGDGVVFYFHGKSNEHFSLISDLNFHINARFIGLRPAGRSRDFTWIQALGILFDTHTFIVEATKAEKWDLEVDHLKFFYDGLELGIPEGYPSTWVSFEDKIKVERTSDKNSALITLLNLAEISINVVPITKEDDRIHKYHIPSNDCFAHLEVQFSFNGLSPKVEGILGRTYQPDFVNPAKPGVSMAIMGGEDKYRTSSLSDADCKLCVFSPTRDSEEEDTMLFEPVQGNLDCTSGSNNGYGIACRK